MARASRNGYQPGITAKNAGGGKRFDVILDFGNEYLSGSTWRVSMGTSMTIVQAGTMVYDFGQGFWRCADNTSTLYVGLGTNNSGGTVTAAAGAALAQQTVLVNGRFAAAEGSIRQSYAVGANDFESWGSSSAAGNWFDGYSQYPGRPIFFDYGSADGCPVATLSATSCAPGFPASTIWKVAWSGPAYPLPEIYRTDGYQAMQWRRLSEYARSAHGSYFIFQGSMSQRGACGSGCPGTNNDAGTAWTQLYNALNAYPAIGGLSYGGSAMTDIRWK